MPTAKTGKPAHRPAFQPTDKQRVEVEAMTAFGIDQLAIADLLGVRPAALRRHFRRELDLGAARANIVAAQKLFEKVKAGDFKAIEFWLRTRGGWKETTTIEGDLGFGQLLEVLERRRKRPVSSKE